MALASHARTMLPRRIIRTHAYSHTSTLPLSVREIIPSLRAVSSNSKIVKKIPPPKNPSKEIPIIGSNGKGLFESLGITGRLKMVAVAIFSVLATIESMFWASMLWNKYGQGEE